MSRLPEITILNPFSGSVDRKVNKCHNDEVLEKELDRCHRCIMRGKQSDRICFRANARKKLGPAKKRMQQIRRNQKRMVEQAGHRSQ